MYGEEKVMETSSDKGKQTRTLLDFNFVNRRKFDEDQDKNNRSNDRVRLDSCFVGPSPTLLAVSATLNLFDNPEFSCVDNVFCSCFS